MSFQPSINLMYDIGKAQLFEQYVPNIKQLDIMQDILQSLMEEEQHAHLLIGPYGAGKSLVGAMTTTLLTQQRQTKEIKQFFKDVYMVSSELEIQIREQLSRRTFKWIPITITGKSGDFETIILESIQKQTLSREIQINLKHDATYILGLIETWETEFPKAYQKLIVILEGVEYTVEMLREKLTIGDSAAVALFKSIYSDIALGTAYHNPIKLDFIEQIQFIFDQLAKKKLGLFIVFDEFGRFLQTVSNAKIYETMQQIQDLAELVNRQGNAGLLMITHTGLQQYANANANLTQDELERVEKRFVEHHLISDSSIFYRSAHKLLNKPEGFVADMFLAKDYEQLHHFIMRYNLFADMTHEEIEGTIIEGCQPIHPLTIQLLPSISNVLGQNDRTLYMFLNQFDIDATQGNWYYVDQLFEYFFPDTSMLLTLDSMRFYRLALTYKVSESSLRLVKLGTLLNLVNNRYLLTKDFLLFALGLERNAIQEVIDELIEIKLLRFNPFTKGFELYEGSLVNFEMLFKEIQQKVVTVDTMRIEAIEKIFDQPYYLPLGYNTAKSMTRFIETKFVFGNQPVSTEPFKDGTLIYIIAKNEKERMQLEDSIREYTDDDILFVLTDINLSKISEHVEEYLVLNHMLNNSEILNQDYNLQKEIEMRIETCSHKVQQHLMPLKTFKDLHVQYYLAGFPLPISNIYDFEKCIDQWMFNRFQDTPEVRNESFNKWNIMPIQRKAAISLLDQIIHPSFDGNFNIEGNGPDYLIFATTFKNLRFNFTDLDNQETRELNLLRKKLCQALEDSSRNSIYSLFEIALNKPFGIRAPLVPILVVSLLKDKWHQMAFYSNDFNLADLNATMIYEILNHAADFYEYEIYSLTAEMEEMLKQLNEVFCNENTVIHPNVIFKQLNQWLLSLPKFTQITVKQPENYLQFKQIVKASETDPLAACKLMLDLELTKDELVQLKETLISFVDSFKSIIINETKALFGVTNSSEIKTKYANYIQNSPQLFELVELMEDEANIDKYIFKVVGIRLEDWSDITCDSYFATLTQLLTVKDEEAIRILNGDQVLLTIKEVELSIKGKNIYDHLNRIVTSGGRTMNPDEVKYILYKILQEI
ncbi:hypothetical protein [Lysinibacillus pakistanensis]|uniref:AAA+ ATPase domain-containing protein n=1 Tax=Lysinibacillus pakistanensis TaxID=759811 RepID=A0ABX6DEM3_9BACI|nr:hypothetical protein GDS87_19670 [Lysinibacillus pakistanensis]